MAHCAFCRAEEAPFSEYGVPICRDCLDIAKLEPTHKTSISSVLTQSLTDATLRFDAACIEFTSIVDVVPSGLPDGTQRIRNAARKLAFARQEKERAHHRLEDYLDRKIVPEDLKRTG